MSADNARKLFVGGLADSSTEDDLRAIFEGAGFQVAHLALPRDRESGRLRGFAFITLSTDDEAARARTELQGVDCCGRPLSIREFSQESPKRGATERPPRQEEPTVFLGKLPFDTTVEEVQKMFTDGGVGPVSRVILPLGPDGRPRGFGFATFASADQVDKAVKEIDGATLGGRQIVVSPAQPRGSGGRSEGGPPRSPPRFGDRPPASGGYGGPKSYGGGGGGPSSYSGRSPDSYSGRPSEPPTFPPSDGKGSGSRRRTEGKRKERERRGGGGDSSSQGGSARGGRKRKGGGANWHQWESDDD